MVSRKLLEIKVKAYEGMLGIRPPSPSGPHMPPIPPDGDAGTAKRIQELEAQLERETMRRVAAESQLVAMQKSAALMSAEIEQVRNFHHIVFDDSECCFADAHFLCTLYFVAFVHLCAPFDKASHECLFLH